MAVRRELQRLIANSASLSNFNSKMSWIMSMRATFTFTKASVTAMDHLTEAQFTVLPPMHPFQPSETTLDPIQQECTVRP